MNEHLVPPPTSHPLGRLHHHLGDMDPAHAETTEVLLSLLSQNKALSGNILNIFVGFLIAAGLHPAVALGTAFTLPSSRLPNLGM